MQGVLLHTDYLIGPSLPFPTCMLRREVTYRGKVYNSNASPHGILFFSMMMRDHAKQSYIRLVLIKYSTKVPIMAKNNLLSGN